MPTDIAQRIRAYISKEILFEDQTSLTDDAPLLNGTLDSVGIMQLVSFLEEEFGIEIHDDNITTANFRSARAIADLVQEELRSQQEVAGGS